MQRSGTDRLVRRAAAFLTFVCAAVFLGGLVPGYLEYRSTFKKVEEEIGNLARLFTQHAEDTLAMADGNLLVLRNVLESGVPPEEALAQIRVMKSAGRPSIRSLTYAYIGPTGQAVASSESGVQGVAVADAGLFEHQRAQADRDLVIGVPVIDPATNARVITVSRRVNTSEDAFAGTVIASLEVDALTRFFAGTSTSRRMSVLLARDDSTLLARYPNFGAMIGTKLREPATFRRNVKPGTAGTFHGPSPVDGVNRIIAYNASGQYGVVSSVSVAVEDVVAEWLWPTLAGNAFRLALTVIIAVLGFWGLRQMRRQIAMATALAKSEADFRMLAEGARDPILLLDARGVVRYASPAALVLFERPPHDLSGRHIADLAADSDVSAILVALGNVAPLAGAGTKLGFHYQSASLGQRWYVMAVQVTVQADEHSFVATLRDETDEHRRQLELSIEATTDPLTGLFNRRHFDIALIGAWRQAAETGAPLSLIFADVDRFKPYNDTYGHALGDQCLAAIGENLNEVARRSNEVAARFGGEEFVVLLPGTDSDAARQLAERIRAGVAARAIAHSGNPPLGIVTVSLGVATMRPKSEPQATMARLIDAADRALYAAKEAGRNRVVVLSDGEAPPETDATG